jgi:hypothetical protein
MSLLYPKVELERRADLTFPNLPKEKWVDQVGAGCRVACY